MVVNEILTLTYHKILQNINIASQDECYNIVYQVVGGGFVARLLVMLAVIAGCVGFGALAVFLITRIKKLTKRSCVLVGAALGGCWGLDGRCGRPFARRLAAVGV